MACIEAYYHKCAFQNPFDRCSISKCISHLISRIYGSILPCSISKCIRRIRGPCRRAALGCGNGGIVLSAARRSIGFGFFALNVGVFCMARQTQRSQATSLTTRGRMQEARQAADRQAETHQAADHQADHDSNAAK